MWEGNGTGGGTDHNAKKWDHCRQLDKLNFDMVKQGACMGGAGRGIDDRHGQHRHGQIGDKNWALHSNVVYWSRAGTIN